MDEAAMTRELQLLRGQAIEAYSDLEFSLCLLFSALLQTKPDLGGTIFFKVTSASARNRMIEALLDKRFGNKFDLYWYGTKEEKGLMRLINAVDQRRNEIVHWKAAITIATNHLHLAPPNFWDRKDSTPEIAPSDIREFCAKADFISKSLTNFYVVTLTPLDQDQSAQQTWLEIFARPVAYPPENTHPLFQSWKARQTQSQS